MKRQTKKLMLPLILAMALVLTQVLPALAMTWTAQTSGTTESLSGVAYGNSQWVAVGANGTILTSSNGANWTAQTSGVTTSLYNIAYGNDQWVAVGFANVILTSPDSITWTADTPTGFSWSGVASDGSQWVAVGLSGTIVTSVSAPPSPSVTAHTPITNTVTAR